MAIVENESTVETLKQPLKYKKAIAGAILAGLTAAGTAIAKDGIDPAEIIGIATAVVSTFIGVYWTENKD